MTERLTPFCKDVMTSANRNGVDALCNLPDWVIAEMMRGIVETIWMYQRGAVTPAQMERELNGEEAARREVKQPAATAPADDLVERLRDENPTFLLNEQAAERIEAQEWKIAALEDARDIHIAQAKRAETENARLRAALNEYMRAAEGFASAVRDHSGTPYPWAPLEIALDKARAALEGGD